MIKKLLILLLVGLQLHASAQVIDNTAAFRNTGRDHFFRFHYDNDYFTKTDEYYSQGIMFEYVAPGLKKFFLSKLLLRPFSTDAGYGVALHIFGYTPGSIRSDEILYGDRPFDSNISFQTFSIQVDAAHRQKISSFFSLGVMGPAALGYDIQYNIHKWTGNVLPHGWQFQIHNDAIINYQVNYEKQLIGSSDYFLLNAAAEARIGTLNDKINAGFNMMTGRFNNRYNPVAPDKRKTEYYFYLQGRTNLVGYDASMQGGVFNKTSPYTIAASDITRAVFQADAGIIVNFKKVYLSYTQSYLTREFTKGHYHRWGGVSAGFAL
ncbi:MAG: lipid A deacylase LpxR family protein [Bacteroidota bacterium]